MDRSKNYYATFKGKNVTLMDYNRKVIRKFIMKAEVVNAQVSGSGKDAYVAIVMKDGKTYLYSASGRLIRK